MRWVVWICAAFAVLSPIPSMAQSRYEVSVTRKVQNFYKVDNQRFWIKTRYCYEYVYYEDSLLSNYEIIFLDSGSKCDVDKIYREISPRSGNYEVSVSVEDNSYSTLDGLLLVTPNCYQYVYYEDAIFRSNGYGGGTLVFLDAGKTCEVERVLSETRL